MDFTISPDVHPESGAVGRQWPNEKRARVYAGEVCRFVMGQRSPVSRVVIRYNIMLSNNIYRKVEELDMGISHSLEMGWLVRVKNVRSEELFDLSIGYQFMLACKHAIFSEVRFCFMKTGYDADFWMEMPGRPVGYKSCPMVEAIDSEEKNSDKVVSFLEGAGVTIPLVDDKDDNKFMHYEAMYAKTSKPASFYFKKLDRQSSSLEIKNKDGKNPQELAEDFENEVMITFLKGRKVFVDCLRIKASRVCKSVIVGKKNITRDELKAINPSVGNSINLVVGAAVKMNWLRQYHDENVGSESLVYELTADLKLMLACRNGDVDMVKVFKEKNETFWKVLIDMPDDDFSNEGSCPLQEAIESCSPTREKVLNLLVESKARFCGLNDDESIQRFLFRQVDSGHHRTLNYYFEQFDTEGCSLKYMNGSEQNLLKYLSRGKVDQKCVNVVCDHMMRMMSINSDLRSMSEQQLNQFVADRGTDNSEMVSRGVVEAFSSTIKRTLSHSNEKSTKTGSINADVIEHESSERLCSGGGVFSDRVDGLDDSSDSGMGYSIETKMERKRAVTGSVVESDLDDNHEQNCCERGRISDDMKKRERSATHKIEPENKQNNDDILVVGSCQEKVTIDADHLLPQFDEKCESKDSHVADPVGISKKKNKKNKKARRRDKELKKPILCTLKSEESSVSSNPVTLAGKEPSVKLVESPVSDSMEPKQSLGVNLECKQLQQNIQYVNCEWVNYLRNLEIVKFKKYFFEQKMDKVYVDGKNNTPAHYVVNESFGSRLVMILRDSESLSFYEKCHRVNKIVIDILTFCLNRGCSMTSVNKNNETPLHIASYCKNVDVAIFLIMQSSSMESLRLRDCRGSSPLMIAVKLRVDSLVYSLLLRQVYEEGGVELMCTRDIRLMKKCDYEYLCSIAKLHPELGVVFNLERTFTTVSD